VEGVRLVDEQENPVPDWVRSVPSELEAIFTAAGAVDEPIAAPDERAPSRLRAILRHVRKAPPSTHGRLVYAIGDIHGRYDLLTDLLGQIVRDYVATANGRKPLVVFCGDYVDRGPDSARVVEAVVWVRQRRDLEVRLLKGNHEQAMLAFIDDPVLGWRWLDYGGNAALKSYSVALPTEEEADLRRARRDLMRELPATHLRLLRNLELVVTAGDYAFVHAGIDPKRALKRQTEEDLLWIRAPFLEAEHRFEKHIVHGHTWTDDQPRITQWRSGIDTGAYRTGVLTALRLDGEETKVMQARLPR
jgi:serine/threonine protein phosphatase 1